MAEPKKTPEQWVEFIAQQELPALTSTAKLLDKFANDDVSSLPRLSKAILHDQGLSSCLLKVANNVQRIGVSQVTTVSRATVVLGIQTVKNICLTSKVMDSLLKNKQLNAEVFNKIKRLMACSFYAGQLAKMMMPDYNDDTREEVYLAAMLYRIGETAFWCLDNHVGNSLNSLVSLPKEQYSDACHDIIGMSFNDLSVALAKQWNLGDLLVKSLDHPEDRAIEMQVISLADKLAEFIDSPPSENEFNEAINDIASIMKIKPRQLAHRIELTREQSIKLLSSYGASTLTEFIKPLPKSGEFEDDKPQEANQQLSKEMANLQALQALSNLTQSSKDINEFLKFTLKSIARILNFDLCTFLLLSNDKSKLSSRFSFDQQDLVSDQKITIHVNLANNVFNQVLTTRQPISINNLADKDVRSLISGEIENYLGNGKAALAAVYINNKNIGVICAQRLEQKLEISAEDFSMFSFFAQQLSMCLSLVSSRN